MPKEYRTSSRDYLVRAQERLRDGTKEALFYAAFELRCGIEARMRQYLEVWDHISRKKKEGWKIVDLGRGVEEAFRLGDRIARVEVHNESMIFTAIFYYTPVAPTLQKHGERLGNYLHSMKGFRESEDPWWNEFRQDLEVIVAQLDGANRGTLLGPPLVRHEGRKALIDMRLELPGGTDPRAAFSSKFQKLRVTYLDRLPSILEPQAHIWNVCR